MRRTEQMLEELSKWFCNHSTTDPIFRPIITLVINDLPLILRSEKNINRLQVILILPGLAQLL